MPRPGRELIYLGANTLLPVSIVWEILAIRTNPVPTSVFAK